MDLEKTLTSDLKTLNEIVTLAEEKANRTYRHEQICTSEEIFLNLRKRLSLIPNIPWTHLNMLVYHVKLCYKKNVSI